MAKRKKREKNKKKATVTIAGKGVIEAFAWETEPGYAVHVLNYTNPNLHRGWMREIYPSASQKVTIETSTRQADRASRVVAVGEGDSVPDP